MNIRFNKNGLHNKSQAGVILIVCLIFLLVFTMMAVGGMETTVLEERMAGNMQDQNRAFQSAEASIEGAEAWLRTQVVLPIRSNNGATGVWSNNAMAAGNDPWWVQLPTTWWTANATNITGLLQVESQPRYIIEEYFGGPGSEGFSGESLNQGEGSSSSSSRTMHRITARGTGANANTEVMLQTTYIRRYN